MNTSNTTSFDEFAQQEMELIFHDPNHRCFTAQAVGHDPSNDELMEHWEKSGAHRRLSKEFGATHPTT